MSSTLKRLAFAAIGLACLLLERKPKADVPAVTTDGDDSASDTLIHDFVVERADWEADLHRQALLFFREHDIRGALCSVVNHVFTDDEHVQLTVVIQKLLV